MRLLPGSSTLVGIAGLVGTALVLTASIVGCGERRKGFSGSAEPTEPGSSEPPPPPSLGETPVTDASSDAQCAAETVSAKRAEVDIIIAIDTSGSMDEEAAQVQSNINKFAAKIGSSGLDYTVLMIGDKPPPFPFPIPVPSICVPPPLAGPSCADNPPLFHHLAQTISSTDALSRLLELYPSYQAWLRATAYKVFIVVTDDNSALGWADFDDRLLARSPVQFGTSAARRYIFDSICGWKTGTPLLDPSKCGTAVNTGDQYQHLSQTTGGIVGSVCEADYSSVFDNIAKGLITKLGCEFNYPKAENGAQTNPSTVVVNYTAAGAASPKALTQVTDASKCGTVADAWYYDDNTTPTKIIFCPSTCEGPGADTGGKVDIAVGCTAPPPQ